MSKKSKKNGNGNGNGKPRSALRIERRSDGVAILYMNVPGEKMNTLRANFTEEFEAAFRELRNAPDVRAVVFASEKEDNFVAGADIDMLKACRSAADAEALSRGGQRAMDEIAHFEKPVVAAIHGACLGGGLELAMACHERVASDDPKTKLGVPEVQLGLLPGAGGTQRLPQLVGLQQALDLMLTGRQVPAKKALRMGLVDEVVPKAIVVEVAAQRALRHAAEPPKKKRPLDRLKELFEGDELKELALAENPLGRKVVFDQAKKQLLKKTHGNYPAPERILEVVRTGLEHGHAAGFEAEAHHFGELVVSPEAAELMGIFFATQELKKDSGVDRPVETPKVTRVGMLGAGLMGAGIAYVTADKAGIPVRLKDRDDEGVSNGLRYVRRILDGRVKKRRMRSFEADSLMYRVTGTTDYSGFGDCQVVIEAVFEDLSLKQRMVREVEEAGPDNVIFASNTSSLPISAIAEASKHPETVIGMHYFSPVEKMPLLEIITTEKTAPWVTATCVELGKRQGKTVIVVRDGTGFYTTRILVPFMNEAFYVLSEGVPVELIDKALMDFGFPVGPIKLTDEVGIDVGAKVGKVMVEAFGDRMQAAAGMEKLVADNRLGRKNKRGFYRYDDKKGVDESVYDVLGIKPTKTNVDLEDIAYRCALQMVNEAAHCMGEGILRSERDGNIGAIFGLGFPPFLGGPFRLIEKLGKAEIVRRLERYRSEHGARFEPAPYLREQITRPTPHASPG